MGRRVSTQIAVGLLLALTFECSASRAASPVATPPLDESASCASSEYAALKQQATTSTGNTAAGASSTQTLVVVSGQRPINTTKDIKMGQALTVCVMGLYNWIYVQKKNPATLRLLIGGSIFSNLAPSSVGPPNQEYLNFDLHLDTENSSDWTTWANIVDASRHGSEDYNLPISIAVADTKEVFESHAFVKVLPYPRYWYLLLLLFVILLSALIYLAAKTDLLRYAIGKLPTLPARSPYSLGLVQMAFWFYLVLAAYVYICVTTRQVHVPMGSVLGLLGISSTTGLAAIFVDKQKVSDARDKRNQLLAEQASLRTRIGQLEAMTISAGSAAEKELADKKTRATEVDADVAQLPPDPPPPTSKGLISDLLNDGDGVSFHRFQIVIWTIVLGIVFVWSAYKNISMPEFDASMLTLMGISSGTYVGFKFPEKLKT
jgi:hypothetical protein